MVNIVMGPEGSGKTKLLIDAISRALKTESGSMVCIEKGHTLRYDVDHRVRLIDASEYSIKSYTLLQGFISGLHAGNFDITHIFIDSLYKVANCEGDIAETKTGMRMAKGKCPVCGEECTTDIYWGVAY